jgi:hypothetical protein
MAGGFRMGKSARKAKNILARIPCMSGIPAA